MDTFPYGKAPLFILLLAVITGLAHWGANYERSAARPDIIFAIFARNHELAYRPVIPDFEKAHGVRIQMQRMDSRALQNRLQSALLTGAAVPDMVELVNPSMGYFTRGPLEDVGFEDLTDRLHAEGLYDRLVQSRFSLWSSRGRIFGLPHDVHPVMLCYRRDIVAQLGVDVNRIRTWDDFARMGRTVTKDLDGDGVPDRYALELSATSDQQLSVLARQRGTGLFDADGRVIFDNEKMADTIVWCVHQAIGPDRIGYDPGWGQSFAKAMSEGLVLFYICPDWRTRQFMMDVPNLKGKLALMALPAWEEGGCRTSCWGGTGLVITKACKNQDLAWQFAKFLYLDRKELGRRFLDSNIIPPLKDAWDLPELNRPSEFFCGQRIGRLYAEIAPQTPPEYASPYTTLAQAKLIEAYLNAGEYYRTRGDKGLEDFTMKELARCANYVREVMNRNVFLHLAQNP
jgi:arabinosaccharide transport system substrate-binding protein